MSSGAEVVDSVSLAASSLPLTSINEKAEKILSAAASPPAADGASTGEVEAQRSAAAASIEEADIKKCDANDTSMRENALQKECATKKDPVAMDSGEKGVIENSNGGGGASTIIPSSSTTPSLATPSSSATSSSTTPPSSAAPNVKIGMRCDGFSLEEVGKAHECSFLDFFRSPSFDKLNYIQPIDDDSCPPTPGCSKVYTCADISSGKIIRPLVYGIPHHPDLTSHYKILQHSAEKFKGDNFLGWREQILSPSSPPSRSQSKSRPSSSSAPQPSSSIEKPVFANKYTWLSYEEALKKVNAIGVSLSEGGEIQSKVQKIETFPSPYSSIDASNHIMTCRIAGIWSKNRPEWTLVDYACNGFGYVSVPLYDTFGPDAVKYIFQLTEMSVCFVEGSKIKTLLDLKENGIEQIDTVVSFDPVMPEEIERAGQVGVKLLNLQTLINRHMKAECKPPETSIFDLCTIIFTSGYHKTAGGPVNPSTRCLFWCPSSLYSDVDENTTIAGRSRLVRSLFNSAVSYKIENYEINARNLQSFFPDLLLKKVKKSFGRIRVAVSGSAPMDGSELKRLSVMLSAPICEGWGMTECGILFLQDFEDNQKGTIGGAFPHCEFKVASISEMQYDATGTPCRGELLVRGPGVMVGYLKDEHKTREALDEEGWLHTGDVVEILPNGALKIIDRAKQIFKLSQGEYIAPEKLENIYVASPLVEQIMVHGDSLKAFPVAVVVPQKQAVELLLKENPKLTNEALKALILSDFADLAKKNNLNSLETIKYIVLLGVDDVWTIERDELTPTFKLVRRVLLAKYKEDLDNLYVTELRAQNGKN